MLDLFHANGAKRARDDVSWILIRQGFAVMLHPLLHLAEDKLNRVVIRRVWWQKNHSRSFGPCQAPQLIRIVNAAVVDDNYRILPRSGVQPWQDVPLEVLCITVSNVKQDTGTGSSSSRRRAPRGSSPWCNCPVGARERIGSEPP